MTLDEAIISMENQADLLEESAAGYDLCDSVEKKIAYRSGKNAREFRQLAEWLKDYKKLKAQEPCEDCVSRQAAIEDEKSWVAVDEREKQLQKDVIELKLININGILIMHKFFYLILNNYIIF